ncbi:hypothetical protein K3495_g14965 [Podosphaera aphanis]|nr:hypothetical protein K3495_g14965 [Podosphaera aphanis]
MGSSSTRLTFESQLENRQYLATILFLFIVLVLRPFTPALRYSSIAHTIFLHEIFDKELLAIVNAFETWTSELGSVEASTLVLTDHKNLEHFTTTKKLNRRQVRWNELLADFNFKIVFRPGIKGTKPDALTIISADIPSESTDSRNEHQFQTLLKPSQILRRLEVTSPGPTTPTESPLAPISELVDWGKHCLQDKYCQEIRAGLRDPTVIRSDIQLGNVKI